VSGLTRGQVDPQAQARQRRGAEAARQPAFAPAVAVDASAPALSERSTNRRRDDDSAVEGTNDGRDRYWITIVNGAVIGVLSGG
jgi:hypothetical protein